MAILRLSNGKVYATYEDINNFIAPAGMTVGPFSYPEALQAKVAEMPKPLTKESLELIFGELSSSAEGMMKDANYSYASSRAAAYLPPKTEGGKCTMSMAFDGSTDAMTVEIDESDLDDYKLPHVMRTNNWHFAFASTMAKGIQLADGVQCMIYITAGEWMRLDPTCFNWVLFPSGGWVVGLSYFEDAPNAEGQWETEVTPDHVVSETMKY